MMTRKTHGMKTVGWWLAACGVALLVTPAAGQRHPSFVEIEDVPGRPRVLLIGDSISMQYTLPVRAMLRDVANVHRPARNCRSTRQTIAELDDYLGDGSWDIIHFNWGIHDLTMMNEAGRPTPAPEGRHQVPIDTYRENIRLLLDRLERTGTRLIWATTTPIGRAAEAKGFRWDRDVVAYNQAAAEAMKERDVVVNDLYTLVKPRAEELLRDGVHFNEQGVNVLAEAVSNVLLETLADGMRPKEAREHSCSTDCGL